MIGTEEGDSSDSEEADSNLEEIRLRPPTRLSTPIPRPPRPRLGYDDTETDRQKAREAQKLNRANLPNKFGKEKRMTPLGKQHFEKASSESDISIRRPRESLGYDTETDRRMAREAQKLNRANLPNKFGKEKRSRPMDKSIERASSESDLSIRRPRESFGYDTETDRRMARVTQKSNRANLPNKFGKELKISNPVKRTTDKSRSSESDMSIIRRPRESVGYDTETDRQKAREAQKLNRENLPSIFGKEKPRQGPRNIEQTNESESLGSQTDIQTETDQPQENETQERIAQGSINIVQANNKSDAAFQMPDVILINNSLDKEGSMLPPAAPTNLQKFNNHDAVASKMKMIPNPPEKLVPCSFETSTPLNKSSTKNTSLFDPDVTPVPSQGSSNPRNLFYTNRRSVKRLTSTLNTPVLSAIPEKSSSLYEEESSASKTTPSWNFKKRDRQSRVSTGDRDVVSELLPQEDSINSEPETGNSNDDSVDQVSLSQNGANGQIAEKNVREPEKTDSSVMESVSNNVGETSLPEYEVTNSHVEGNTTKALNKRKLRKRKGVKIMPVKKTKITGTAIPKLKSHISTVVSSVDHSSIVTYQKPIGKRLSTLSGSQNYPPRASAVHTSNDVGGFINQTFTEPESESTRMMHDGSQSCIQKNLETALNATSNHLRRPSSRSATVQEEPIEEITEKNASNRNLQKSDRQARVSRVDKNVMSLSQNMYRPITETSVRKPETFTASSVTVSVNNDGESSFQEHEVTNSHAKGNTTEAQNKRKLRKRKGLKIMPVKKTKKKSKIIGTAIPKLKSHITTIVSSVDHSSTVSYQKPIGKRHSTLSGPQNYPPQASAAHTSNDVNGGLINQTFTERGSHSTHMMHNGSQSSIQINPDPALNATSKNLIKPSGSATVQEEPIEEATEKTTRNRNLQRADRQSHVLRVDKNVMSLSQNDFRPVTETSVRIPETFTASSVTGSVNNDGESSFQEHEVTNSHAKGTTTEAPIKRKLRKRKGVKIMPDKKIKKKAKLTHSAVTKLKSHIASMISSPDVDNSTVVTYQKPIGKRLSTFSGSRNPQTSAANTSKAYDVYGALIIQHFTEPGSQQSQRMMFDGSEFSRLAQPLLDLRQSSNSQPARSMSSNGTKGSSRGVSLQEHEVRGTHIEEIIVEPNDNLVVNKQMQLNQNKSIGTLPANIESIVFERGAHTGSDTESVNNRLRETAVQELQFTTENTNDLTNKRKLRKRKGVKIMPVKKTKKNSRVTDTDGDAVTKRKSNIAAGVTSADMGKSKNITFQKPMDNGSMSENPIHATFNLPTPSSGSVTVQEEEPIRVTEKNISNSRKLKRDRQSGVSRMDMDIVPVSQHSSVETSNRNDDFSLSINQVSINHDGSNQLIAKKSVRKPESNTDSTVIASVNNDLRESSFHEHEVTNSHTKGNAAEVPNKRKLRKRKGVKIMPDKKIKKNSRLTAIPKLKLNIATGVTSPDVDNSALVTFQKPIQKRNVKENPSLALYSASNRPRSSSGAVAVQQDQIDDITEKNGNSRKPRKRKKIVMPVKGKAKRRKDSWHPNCSFMLNHGGEAFYNWDLLNKDDIKGLVQEVGLSDEIPSDKFETALTSMNSFIEELFNRLCDETPTCLLYGVFSFQALLSSMVEEGLVPSNCDSKTFIQMMKTYFPSEGFRKAQGVLYPNPTTTSRTSDTLNYFNFV